MNKLGAIPLKHLQSNYQKNISEKLVNPKKVIKDYDVILSSKAKNLKREIEEAKRVEKINLKQKDNLKKPGIFFVSGFDWFGAGSIKGNHDGMQDLSKAIKGSQKFAWDEQEQIIKEIKQRDSNEPIVLVGHSFGGDSIIEVANKLNTLENGFRQIDLMVTLDSVGFDNDIIPQNVKKNLNFIADGPYEFLNDGPNIARKSNITEVYNELTEISHSDIDDSKDIQFQIMTEINALV